MSDSTKPADAAEVAPAPAKHPLDGLQLVPTIATTETTIQFELADPAKDTKTLINIETDAAGHFGYSINDGKVHDEGFESPYDALADAFSEAL